MKNQHRANEKIRKFSQKSSNKQKKNNLIWEIYLISLKKKRKENGSEIDSGGI